MSGTRCDACGEAMNPVAALMGPTCGDCSREKHKEAARP